VLLDAPSFGARPPGIGASNMVSAVGLPAFLVRRGDDLASALSTPLVDVR
jgi:hypothetical protein